MYSQANQPLLVNFLPTHTHLVAAGLVPLPDLRVGVALLLELVVVPQLEVVAPVRVPDGREDVGAVQQTVHVGGHHGGHRLELVGLCLEEQM